MSLEAQLEAGIYLILATLLSMIIGIDRERRQQQAGVHSAGLRTHMLTGVGACLFTLLSIHAFPGGDTTRIAANIVTGIGFLGAGTIIRGRHGAYDLTTAASIWATAAVGMAVGAGVWLLAAFGTLIIWIILAVIRRFEPEKIAANPPSE